MARLTGWLLLWAPLPLLAEETAKAGEIATSGGRAPDTVATILSLGAGLLAVVAIIYGCAWLIRRMSGMTGMNNNAFRCINNNANTINRTMTHTKKVNIKFTKV